MCLEFRDKIFDRAASQCEYAMTVRIRFQD